LVELFENARKEHSHYKAPKSSRFIPKTLNMISNCDEVTDKIAL